MEATNNIDLIGTACGAPEYSHSVLSEAFYTFPLAVRRLSGTEDRLILTVSERLLGEMPVDSGARLFVNGQIRSYNRRTETGSRLIVTVFVREIAPAEDESADLNEVELGGCICKPVVYRKTPFEREIADILLAVGRRSGKSDYLPLIAWGRNARYLADMPVGTRLSVAGRLQSREYRKVFDDSTEEKRIAYEVSCASIETSFE